MTDFMMAGAAVALLTLIFTSYPFMNLIYFLAVQSVTDWATWSEITGIFFLTFAGVEIYKRLTK